MTSNSNDNDPHQASDSSAQPCPCGSGHSYRRCCLPAICGEQPAGTALALMRSRYSAFALGEVDYLIASTHPDFRADLSRASLLQHHRQTRWLRLCILSTEAGNAEDSRGRVQFSADYAEQPPDKGGRLGPFGSLQEHSNFQQIEGRWYYCDGRVKISPLKPERNAPCPCGSMKKFKKCCA